MNNIELKKPKIEKLTLRINALPAVLIIIIWSVEASIPELESTADTAIHV